MLRPGHHGAALPPPGPPYLTSPEIFPFISCLGSAVAQYWVDVAVEALEKNEHHVPPAFELFTAAIATILQIVMAAAVPTSHVTNLGGVITGFVITVLFLPKFLMEDLEAYTPFVAIFLAVIIFLVLPGTYYGTIGDPQCAFYV